MNRPNLNKKPLACAMLASALSLGVSAPVLAQSSNSASLEEVIVSATRRSESLQEVPISVSAITAEALNNSGVFETSDLNNISPNMSVSSPYGSSQPNFSIRGVGVGTEFNANAASPIGVYVDEVYQTFRATHGQQLFDLNQIEVVRGPQGTLFGRNTTGGAINFISRKPQLEGTSGYLTLGMGNYNRKNIEGAVEFTPVAETLGIRIAATYVDTDPYVENVLGAGPSTAAAFGLSGLNANTGGEAGGTQNYGIRTTMRVVPSDGTDITFKVYAAKSEGGTDVPLPTGSSKTSDVIDYTNPNFLLGGIFSALAPAGLLPASYSQSARGLGLREIESDSAGTARTEAQGMVVNASFTLSDTLDFIAIAGYDSGEYQQSPTDCDSTPLALCTLGYNSEFDAVNLDMRFDYTGERLKMIVGAFYGSDTLTSDNKPNFFNFLRDVNTAVGSPVGYFNPGGAFNLPATLAALTVDEAAAFGALSASSLPTGITADQHFKQERDSYAIYGEANFSLTDTVTITAGARYSSDDLDFSEGKTTYFDDTGAARLITVSDYTQGGVSAPYFVQDVLNEAGNVVIPAALASPGPTPGGLERSGSSSKVSGRVIIDWKPDDSTMYYASFSRGYRAGTFNGLAYGSSQQVYFVPPEEVDAFEYGVKMRLMEDRLQINGSAFLYDYTGQQGQVVDASATANLVSLDGEVSGVEVDILYAVNDKLTLNASLGLLHSEYDDGDCPATAITGFPAQQGSCVVSSGGPVSVGGNPFPYAPEESYNLGFNWDIAEAGDGVWSLNVDAAYKGKFYYDGFKDYSRAPLDKVITGKFSEGSNGYWVGNSRLSYTTESFAFGLWVKNITDKEYYPFGIAIENLFANGYRMIAPPRTYGAEVKFMF